MVTVPQDTWDCVHRKINTHLKKPGVMQTSLYTTGKRLSNLPLRHLPSANKKGKYEGNTSIIFYGAYVYFEKLRTKGVKAQEQEKKKKWKRPMQRSAVSYRPCGGSTVDVGD